jgi:hypothetical protein
LLFNEVNIIIKYIRQLNVEMELEGSKEGEEGGMPGDIEGI